MRAYVTGRLLQVIPVLLGVSIIVFLLLVLAPGDPAAALLGVQATPEELARVRRAMGLDRPVYIRYVIWLGDVLKGDLGVSYISKRPVTELIAARFPPTLQLTVWGTALGTALGVPAGVISATKRYTAVDYAISSAALFGVSMPSFWFAILLILLFSLYAGWLPSSGYYPMASGLRLHLRHLVLPTISLGLFLAGGLARFTRSSMIDTMIQDYVRTARAKGLSERVVIYRHALKNALIPTVTVLGLQLGLLVGGAVIIEQVYAYPGLGTMALTAISQRDYPVVMGVVLLVASAVVVSNLIVDLLYTYLDPRIRYGTEED